LLERLVQFGTGPIPRPNRGCNHPWADCVHPDPKRGEIRGKIPGEGANRSLAGGVSRGARSPDASSDGCVQNDRRAWPQKRDRLLHREEHALDVDIEDLIENFLGGLGERFESADTCIGEENVESAKMLLYLGKKVVDLFKVSGVALHHQRIWPK